MWNLPKGEYYLDYYENVIRRYFTTAFHTFTELPLPMIPLSLSKHNALPPYLWGLVWESWNPEPSRGTSVFLTAYEDRGTTGDVENMLKRQYYAGITPDLYHRFYQPAVQRFFERWLGTSTRGLPLMQQYLDGYWDLYWHLHLGLSGLDVPSFAREIGASFNTCLANIDVLDPTFQRNYMNVRNLRPRLDRWVAQRIEQIRHGLPGIEQTIAFYWLANGMAEKNVVFECFHNFVALSQWGHAIYRIIDLLREGGDPKIRAAYEETLSRPDRDRRTPAEPFSPFDRLVMELFRKTLPNTISISAQVNEPRVGESVVYTFQDHAALAQNPVHWQAPEMFDPDRYADKPTSIEPNDERARRLALTRCPFEQESFEVWDGRSVALTNSGFGTVYPVVDGQPYPVVDAAGYSPFGFGYRRCPGELMTILVIQDFLLQLRREEEHGAHLVELQVVDPELVPVGPSAMVVDDIGLIDP